MKTFNIFFTLLIAIILVLPANDSMAAKKPNKQAKKEMKRKAYKQARKEARRFRKKGWYVAPGALPMDKQIEKSWELQYKLDENGYPIDAAAKWWSTTVLCVTPTDSSHFRTTACGQV